MVFKLNDNEALLKLIVKAVEKGVGEDVRDYRMATNKATNNAIRFMRADNIFTNLRDSVPSDIAELKHFTRCAWEGCLLIDRRHKMTYTICSRQALEAIPKKKDRRIPHYLQTILHVQNAYVEVSYQQMTLGDYDENLGSVFSEEEYLKDYSDIMEDDISFDDGYTHMVVVYEVERLAITSIAVKLLNADFLTAEEYSLIDLLKPDFSDLTVSEKQEQRIKDSRGLVSVKSGLVKHGDASEQQDAIVSPKKMEETRRA